MMLARRRSRNKVVAMGDKQAAALDHSPLPKRSITRNVGLRRALAG